MLWQNARGVCIVVPVWRECGRKFGCQILVRSRSSMELSRTEVAQRHGHVPISAIWAGPWTIHFTNLAPVRCRL